MGELENFPPEARSKIQDAGGFESFLLESLRFIKMGRCVGLAKHAVSLQQAGHGAGLDDLDVIVDPEPNPPYDDFEEAACSSAETDVCPVLPNPYEYKIQAAGDPRAEVHASWSLPDDGQQNPYSVFNGYERIDLYTAEVEGGVLEKDFLSGGTVPAAGRGNISKEDAAVQVGVNVCWFYP